MIYRRYLKRPWDFILALFAIVLLSPVLLVIGILVRTKLGAPILFKQERPGRHEKIFTIYKFRTMTDAVDEEGQLLPDDQRLTRFGKLLRSTSLDELPELFNILKGNMSFVGPRPLLVQYLPLYNDEQRKRHHVRPGLTGHAQINGRNSITWEEKFTMDVAYVEELSLRLDASIFFKTISYVLLRTDISSNTSETMEIFTGNSQSYDMSSD